MYRRRHGERTLAFGHEGVLFRGSFVLYDTETRSLWVHTLGTAVKGPLAGEQLDFFPATVTTLARWREKHPDTLVLPGKTDRGFMGTYALTRSPVRYGLSLGQGEEAKLYPFRILMEEGVVNDEFDGEPIAIVWDGEGSTAVAFRRGDRKLRLEEGRLIDGAGGIWDPITGEEMGEEKAGPKEVRVPLTRLPATPWLIARWRVFYPEGSIYAKPAPHKE